MCGGADGNGVCILVDEIQVDTLLYNCCYHPAASTIVAEFAQIDALPCAEVQTATGDGDAEAYSCKTAFGMSRHVIVALEGVVIVRFAFAHEVVIDSLHVVTHVGVGIFVDAEGATGVLDELEIPYEVHIYSAHRTPVEARDFALNARKNGFGAIIAAAGMAAHLAGAIAANTTLPVVGIPIKSGYLNGIDALLSTVQMPSGIPVATVAIDGAVNAALLCIQILAVEDAELANRLDAKRKADAEKVLEKNKAVEAQ